MNLNFDVILLISGGFIRIIDFCSDVWYVYTQDFASDLLLYLSVFFLFAPMLALLLGIISICISNCCKQSTTSLWTKTLLGLLVSLGEPIGFGLFLFGIALLINKPNERDFFVVEAFARVSGFLDGSLESFPEIIIQSYNNHILDQWNLATICSVGLSTAGLIYSLIRLLYAIDKMRHHEIVSAHMKDTISQTIGVDKERVSTGDEDPYENLSPNSI